MTDLVIVQEANGTVVVQEQVSEVIEVVAAGPQGGQGVPGPKGDTGDLTPAATAAKEATEAAAAAALVSQTSANNSATSASASAGIATTKAAEAATSASNAATAATTATTKANEASASAAGIAGAVTTATTKASEASASAAAALTSSNNAATSATAAAGSATTATTKATEAATSATAAAGSATTASNQATIATTKASEASSSAGNAASFASAAAASATTAGTGASTATTQATAAGASATAAQTSATSAASSATSATASKDAAAISATTASTKASEAATSATSAQSSATTATTQAGIATTKASEASTSATNAAGSATAASGSASTASTQASNAASSAAEAQTSATNAAASESAVAANAATATTQAGIATTKASEAATSASTASTGAATATTKASEAAASATSALAAKVAAETVRDQTLAAFDSFDDRYLGPKAVDPTVDNDGNPLVGGSLYFNTNLVESGGGMKVYDGSVWRSAYASLSGALLSSNNLSDLASASAARINLGLGNVEDKSSATIRSELTSGNVTAALGFTPYNAANPDGYITSSALTPYLTSATAATTYQPVLTSGTSIKTVNGQSVLGSGNIQIDGGVVSFNTRTGAVTLGSGDVTGALGFTPYDAANPAEYITSSALSPYLTSATAGSTYQPLLGYTAANKAGDTFTGDVVINTKLAVGTSITANTNYRFGRGISGGVSSSAFVQNGNVQSDVTTTAVSFNSQANTAAAAFTLTNYFHYYAQQGVIGAGSSITAITGFYADNTLLGATNTYGFRGGVGSGSGRWNLFMDGTASNYFAGSVAIGTLTVGTKLDISDGTFRNQMRLHRSNGTSDTTMGSLLLAGNNASGTLIDYAGVESYATSSTAGAEQGALRVVVRSGGSLVERWRFGDAGQLGIGGANYGTSGQFLKSGGASAAASWGLLTSGEVTTALGFTPYNATNPNGYTSNTGTVTSVGGTGTVSGLTLTGTVTGSGNLTLGGTLTLTSGQVTTALGFTPYNSTNPSGYITSSSLSSYLSLGGGTMTGQITTRITTGTTPIVSGGGSDSLQIMGSTTSGAFLSFHRGGAYAINMGLDTGNVLTCGGWSDGGNYRWQADTSGNFTARGNVTAYSDERLKKDWADLPADFIEQLAKVKHGTYTRIDSGERQAGVSAQGLQAVLSESVMKDGQGNLSVAYGNAALTAAVELAARVIALEARLAALEV